MRRQNGFSLVEILIVVGIVAVILGLLLPVLVSAKESGRATVCISNMRQLSQAILLYVDTNDGSPRGGSSAMPWEKQIDLAKPIPPQQGASYTGILVCPSHQRANGDESSTGYALNGCYQRARSIPEPSNSILVAESATVEFAMRDGSRQTMKLSILEFPDSFIERPGFFLQQDAASARPIGKWGSKLHGEKGHYAFVDGHVSILATSQIAVPKNDKACRIDAAEWLGPIGGPHFALLDTGGNR